MPKDKGENNKLASAESTEDAKSNEQLQKEAKEHQEQIEKDIVKTMSEPHGRRFVWQMINDAGVFKPSFTGNSTTYFNEGSRNLGLKYLELTRKLCKKSFLKMIDENF